MVFDDLEAAFEEMVYMVKETGHTYRIIHSGTRSPTYHVVQKSGCAKVPFLIAELNCRNVVGDEDIQKRRSKKMRRVRGKDKLKT